jgi:ribosomal-protein-alanine N-acetyltransferase
VRINGDDKLIGFVGVWRIDPEKREAEIGYMLAPAQWNRGLAGEALGALMQQADICLPNYRFVAQVHHAHKASIRLLERFGFQLAPANGIEDVDCVRYVRPAYQPGE